MKKTLLILCALVCGTFAFAQTEATYTDNLHIKVGNDDEGVQQGKVTVVYDSEDDHTIIDFTLHDLYAASYHVGDITVKGIQLGDEEDGVAEFSCTEDHDVTLSGGDFDGMESFLTITVNMTGDISTEKIHASMDIAVSVLGVININITATFGYDYEYLIVNAATGNYLGGGLDWGTHATEVGKPQFFLFIDQFDGTYNLFGNQGGTSIGWSEDGSGLYVDGATPLTWEVTEVDGGYYIVSEDGYLTGNGFQEGVTVENTAGETAVWKLVTMDDVLATMDEATISNPVDVTPLIPAPEPKRADWGSSWVATGYGTSADAGNVSLGGGSATANCAESYHSNNGFDVRQTISSLPAGYYELTAQAFYRNDGGDVIPSMYITTGTSATDTNGSFENVHLPEHYTTSGNMADAYQEFLQGQYPVSLTFIVDEEDEEFTVGFESNTTTDDAMWTIFGELGLLYMGTELPELTAVTGTMNATVKSTMETAIATYEANKTSANYIAAEQAIFDAEESVAYYASITAIVENLDEAGLAEWNSSTSGQAYANLTLTDEDVSTDLVAAQKAQTTEGSDLTYALLNSGEWTGNTGTYGGGVEHYQDGSSGGACEAGKILYNTVEGLASGTYEVTFYAVANMAWNDYAYGKDIAQVFVNDVTEDIEVINQVSFEDLSAYSYTLIGTVGSDGVLEFGLQNIATGGNWYVAEAVSLTLVALAEEEDPYIYDITSLLANPSFELDVVDNLTVDGGHCDETVGGAWSVSSLTGWTLAAPTGGYAVSDLMTKDATATDNNFGVPGSPSDKTYMLYLRNSHLSYSGTGTSASVMQDVTLPAGEYKLTVDSKCVASGSAGTVSLVAGDESQALDIHVKTTTVATDPFLDAWDTATLTFSLTETTALTLGVNIAYDTSNDVALSILLDNFQLFSTEEVETVEYNYDVTWALANPSFEVDNVVANLTADTNEGATSRCTGDGDGAWTITSLTGWDLSAASNSVCDLMSAKAAATDNDFGAPGEPADGTYMLYLRDSWATAESTVKQDVTLPAGDYKVTVNSKCISTSGSKATLVVDEKTKALTINSSMPEGWNTATLTFSLDDETTVSLGVVVDYTGANGSFLLDNFKLYSVDAIEKEISWTMTDAGWGTMILPFAATLDENLTAYSCNGTEDATDDEGNEMTVVSLEEVGQSITANTPYIIKCTDDSAVKAHSFTGTPTNTVETYTDGILTGTLVDLAVAKGAAFATDGTQYLLQNQEEVDGVAFYPIIIATDGSEDSSEATLDAYHCYLDLSLVTTSARPVALHFPGAGEETGIVAVESETLANDAIYDLSGRRVSKAVKGVYIQNGKKVLVK